MSLRFFRSSLSATAALALFGAAIAWAQPGGEEEYTLNCDNMAMCSGSKTCEYGSTTSCCRQGAGQFVCTCCNTEFDCLNPPSGWNCNDAAAGD